MIARPVSDSRDHSCKASRGFRGFIPEVENSVRPAPEVRRDEKLDAMIRAWKEFRFKHGAGQGRLLDTKNYSSALESVRALACSSETIERFSIALAGSQNQKEFCARAGIFISALINNSPEGSFRVHTGHLSELISSLGFYNTKEITVEGDVGDFVGLRMKGGRIRVNGNARHHVGWSMENGTIIVNGSAKSLVGNGMKGGLISVMDAEDRVGSMMKGGRIMIGRDAGANVGANMDGGVICLNGDFGGISEFVAGGRIYHKGKLIVDTGLKLYDD